MDRRSGLKKAHFSSVPTRMSLLTCKKYVFLIEKNFPSHPKIGKTQHNAFLWVALETQHNAFYGSRWKLNTMLSMGRVGNSTQCFLWVALETQHNAFLWVALENSTQRFPMGRVGKLNTTLSYGSRWKTQHNAFLWVALENSAQRFPMGRVVGLVMVKGVLLSSLASIPFALYRIHVSKKN
ncbi:hypothetical protein LEP1GSC104_0383 [Leptospira interrogans str. UI 12621]|uniref:Uncharacterized protein n=1 Tax=Leptospira interrogans str. UI 12621 TaxID=1049937 RepID=A0A0F6H9P4_LEPIR|nr:hypothetical protein LEP1GSC104_0383 [Leptospira interrogans str. UI 12621]